LSPVSKEGPMDDLALDNPAWAFCLTLYRTPGVADELLALQDEIGLDVSLLLVCLWLGAERAVALTDSEIRSAQALVAPWTAQVVHRLRAVRRDIKARPEMARPAVAALRGRVQRLEIEAEQIQIALLHEWGSALPSSDTSGAEAAARNLDRVLGHYGADGGDVACVHLRAALGVASPH
jgi:uncharacterized protein (TIGR02444 family)